MLLATAFVDCIVRLIGAVRIYFMWGPPPPITHTGSGHVIVINIWPSYFIIIFEILLLIYFTRPKVKEQFK